MKDKIKLLTSKTVRVASIGIVVIAMGIGMMLHGFFEFQQTIINQQQQQMLTVAKSVASSISIYINGYMSDMMVLRSSDNFIRAYQTYDATGDHTVLLSCMESYAAVRPSSITGVCLLSDSGEYLFGTSGTEQYAADPIEHTSSQMLYFTSSTGEYCIGIALPVYQKYWLVCLLNISDMYQRIGYDVRMGNTGYVMIMASNGRILMHPTLSEVGKNIMEVSSGAYDKKHLPDLLSLVQNQENGETGVAVVRAVDKSHPNSGKTILELNAYTSAWLRDDFLIVCAVANYNAMVSPLHASMIRILLDASLVFACASVLMVLLLRLQMKHRHYSEEIRTLREVNQSLEELHAQEEQIQHSQRLQTIGTLTGGIAHEFSNLLTPIMGYSGMMLVSLPQDSELREDAEEIYHSAEKAKEIIQQITTLSRKNSAPAFQKIDLEKMGTRIIKIAKSVMPENIRLDTSLAFDRSSLLGNESQLSQVILNLCANAINAIGSRKDGHLQICGKLLPAYHLPPEVPRRKGCTQYALLSFTDNGCGIEPRLLERIFEPFFTTKQAGQGTGLGLSIVQSIIENHGGRILVESTPGKGSTFAVYLPTYPDQDRSDITSLPDQAPVVLVDNNPKMLHMLEKYLSKKGYLTTAFRQPQEALEYLQTHACMALVTDYSMPEMSGAQLAISVRSVCPDLCILLLSSRIEREFVEYRHRGIIDDYMLKPVSCEDVGARLVELLSKSGQQGSNYPDQGRKQAHDND